MLKFEVHLIVRRKERKKKLYADITMWKGLDAFKASKDAHEAAIHLADPFYRAPFVCKLADILLYLHTDSEAVMQVQNEQGSVIEEIKQ